MLIFKVYDFLSIGRTAQLFAVERTSSRISITSRPALAVSATQDTATEDGPYSPTASHDSVSLLLGSWAQSTALREDMPLLGGTVEESVVALDMDVFHHDVGVASTIAAEDAAASTQATGLPEPFSAQEWCR